MQSLTIGNLGGAGTNCFFTNYPAENPHIDLSCPRGLRFFAKDVQIGVMSSEVMDKSLCRRDAILEDVEEYGFSDCTKMMGVSRDKMYATFKKNCHYQKKCTLPLDEIAFDNDPKSSVCKKDATFYI